VSQTAIAERYARAIFELANETGELVAVTEQIRAFADAYGTSEELQKALGNPVVTESSRDGILKDVGAALGSSTLTVNAVRLMARRGRLSALSDIAGMLTRLADEKAGVIRATVTSAKLLPEGYYQSLTRELEQRTSRKVLLERKEDPSLLAGIVTRIGDHTIDGSVRGRLAALERQLLAST
jgi:F-type H+-transporting ATPase subunit delta